MSKKQKLLLKWCIPIGLIGGISCLRWFPLGAEWYARTCYPLISGSLSGISSFFPFSVGDCFIVAACLWLIVYPFYAWKKKQKKGAILACMVLFLMWVYIWFYGAWGINYFRLPFYERTEIERVAYSDEEFHDFLTGYIAELADSYDSVCRDREQLLEPFQMTKGDGFEQIVGKEVNRGYRNMNRRFGLVYVSEDLYPKFMLWSWGISKVGVSGYMGPFFSEFNLNRDLLNVEYPFTYAHELAHRLGIASEAEANLYATLVTTASEVPEIRFSGYFSILGYVMSNARRLLLEEEYKEVLEQIPLEVIEMYSKHLAYWRGKYSHTAGGVQNKIYNAYLKSNQIDTGTKNYSEVVALLMAVRR